MFHLSTQKKTNMCIIEQVPEDWSKWRGYIELPHKLFVDYYYICDASFLTIQWYFPYFFVLQRRNTIFMMIELLRCISNGHHLLWYVIMLRQNGINCYYGIVGCVERCAVWDNAMILWNIKNMNCCCVLDLLLYSSELEEYYIACYVLPVR